MINGVEIEFFKYQGAGNDFIIVNQLQVNPAIDWSLELVAKLCNRYFGIGADGFIIIQPAESADFHMLYYNSDGQVSTLCGNGSRCAVWFYYQNVRNEITNVRFTTNEGLFDAEIIESELVKLKVLDLNEWKEKSDFYFLDTGSPHIVLFQSAVDQADMNEVGKRYRNQSPNGSAGSNVNLVQIGMENKIRTYERGVEGETLACGTGIIASALAKAIHKEYPVGTYIESFEAKGGRLQVYFNKTESGFEQIYLEGPAQEVFKGKVKI